MLFLAGVAFAVGASPAQQPQSSEASASQIAMEFVRIQPGTFMMGCSMGDGYCESNEKPTHQVRITKTFELGKYEVTQAQWRSVMGTNPSHFKGDALPVETVTWNDTQEFLNRMNARRDGFHYRLPTEAEWEYAARAGSAGAPGELDVMAWYYDNSEHMTHPVGQKKANAWGLSDMLGNVYEWVQDWYGDYPGASAIDPAGPATGALRVARGGSWEYIIAWDARVSCRSSSDPSGGDATIGFRILREAIPG